jgi:hypothetical protein
VKDVRQFVLPVMLDQSLDADSLEEFVRGVSVDG